MATEDKSTDKSAEKSEEVASPYCAHGRPPTACEDCAYRRHVDRVAELSGSADRKAGRAPRNTGGSVVEELAREDLVILRVDLVSHDAVKPMTLIRKGEPIPRTLADLPREPVPADLRMPERTTEPPTDAPVVSVV